MTRARAIQNKIRAPQSDAPHAVAATVSSVAAANSEGYPEPPAHAKVTAAERPFWDDIIRSRARDEWSRIEVVWAVQLARVMAAIEALQAELAAGSYTIVTDKGWPATNPKVGAISQLSTRQLRLSNALRITGMAVGDPSTIVNNRKAERQAEGILNKAREGDPEGLLAL